MSKPCADPPTQLPDEDCVIATVALLGAMAHPMRVQVLLALSRLGPLAVGDLQSLLEVEQSALSHQLRTLRDAHLVTGERDGKRVIYQLTDDHVAHIVEDALTHSQEAPDRD